MKPLKLILKNFLSYESIEYDFKNMPLLIEGRNETDDSQESNGSGKSGIEAAMQLAVTDDQYIYQVPKKNLVRFDQKEAYLCAEFRCEIRKQTLRIERKIKKSGGAAQLSINNDIKHSFESKQVSKINEEVIEWFGISKEDLLNYYLISTERFTSLYRSNARSKIELMNRFSNADIVEGVDVYVKKDIDKIEAEVINQRSKRDRIIGAIEMLNNRIEDEKNFDFEADKEERVNKVKQSIASIERNILLKQEEIERQEGAIIKFNSDINTETVKIKELKVELEEAIEAFDPSEKNPYDAKLESFSVKKEKLDETKSKKLSSKHEKTSELDEIESMISDINKNLKGAVTCPNCSHEFSISDADIDIKSERETLEDAEFALQDAKDSLEKVKKSISSLQDSYRKIEDEESEIRSKSRNFNKVKREAEKNINEIERSISSHENSINLIKDRVSNSKKKIKNLGQEIEDLEKDIVGKEKVIKGIEKETYDFMPKIKEIQAKIDESEKSLKESSEHLDELDNELFETKQWIVNFKRFQFHLAAKPLSLIQQHCNYFLKKMNSDLRVKMEGYRENSKKELKEEITPYILRDGEVRLFGSFSGGEKARLEFAMILAIQEMINSTNKYGGLNFLMIDEVLEGTDALGLQNLIKSISDFEFPILITTHVVDRGVNNSKLIIEKVDGISNIIQ